MQENYYMLPEEALPEVFRKIIAVRRHLLTNPDLSISNACRIENLSRSAYYKYRNSLHRFSPPVHKTKVSLHLVLDLGLRADLKLWQALSRLPALLIQEQLSLSGPEEAKVDLILAFEEGEWEKCQGGILSWQQEWHGLKELKLVNVYRHFE